MMPKSSQNHAKIILKSSQNPPKIIPKSCQKHPKIMPKSSQNHAKIIPKSSQTHANIIPKSSKNHLKIMQKSIPESSTIKFQQKSATSCKKPAPHLRYPSAAQSSSGCGGLALASSIISITIIRIIKLKLN